VHVCTCLRLKEEEADASFERAAADLLKDRVFLCCFFIQGKYALKSPNFLRLAVTKPKYALINTHS